MDGLHYTVLFIFPLTCLLLDLYMARTCITIMLLLNLLHSSDAQSRPLNDSRTQRVLEGHVKYTQQARRGLVDHMCALLASFTGLNSIALLSYQSPIGSTVQKDEPLKRV